MKNTILIITLIAVGCQAFCQEKYICRNGHTAFFSTAMVEDIEAHNHQTSGILDMESGLVAASIPISGFKFEKALMQEHFNENYMESGKYPKATFKGEIKDFKNLDFSSQPEQTVKVLGVITLHGVTKPLEVEVKLSRNEGSFNGHAEFDLVVADFNIKIPKVVKDNIAKFVHVNMGLEFKSLPN